MTKSKPPPFKVPVKSKRVIMVLIISTFSLTFCASEFLSKKKVIGELYLIRHKSLKGKALAFVDSEDYFNVLQSDVTTVKGNDSILVTADTSQYQFQYHKLLLKKGSIYKEDLIQIDLNAYNKIIKDSTLDYDFE